MLAWISDEPVADPATYSQYRVAQAAGEHVRVLLGGAGGDELLGGYGHYVLPWKKTAYASLPASAQRVLFQLFARRFFDEDAAIALAEYRHSRQRWHRRSMTHLGLDEEMFLRSDLESSEPDLERLEQLFESFRRYDAVNQQLAVDLSSYLPEQLLPMMDRSTMAASIEGRVPFVDVPLVEFCMSLSGRVKLGWPAVQKRLLKRAIADWVPPQVVQSKKSGMPSHFPTFMAQHPDVVRRLLLGPAVVRAECSSERVAGGPPRERRRKSDGASPSSTRWWSSKYGTACLS